MRSRSQIRESNGDRSAWRCPRVGERSKRLATLLQGKPVVVSEVPRRPDAERAGRQEEEFAAGVLGAHRLGVEILRRDYAFRDIVDAFECGSSGGSDKSAAEEVLEREFAIAPAPPRPGACPRLGELTDMDWPVGAHLVENRLHVLWALHGDFMDVPSRLVIHAMTKQREVFDGDQRGCVSPVLEQFAAPVCIVVQKRLRVRSKPREHWQVMRPDEDIHGVQLQHPDTP